MKLNWAERWVVNNPVRVFQQGLLIRRLAKMMPLPPGAQALEIGCGRGAGAALVTRHFRPSRLHAMDLDLDMIRKARAYLGPTPSPPIFTFVGDAEHLPFSDRTIDVVFGFGVLHHVPHWQAALHEIARVLKVGGAFYFEELYPALYQNFITRRVLLHPEDNRFRSRELLAELAHVGLEVRARLEIKPFFILGASLKVI